MSNRRSRRAALAALLSCLAAASATAQPSTSRYEMRDPGGALVASGELGPGNGPLAIAGAARSPGLRVGALPDPTQPQRLLLRLHDEPLLPYLQRHAAQLRADAAGQGRSPREVLARMRDAHRAQLEREQQALVDVLLGDGVVEAVHGRFLRLTNAISVTAGAGKLDALRRDPRVASVQPDHVVRTSLAASVPMIGADRLWARNDPSDLPVTGFGMTVAVLDTGIDYTHPDLGGCLGAGCKVVGGYDFANDDADPFDDNGHGTHVAGIVAANGTVRGVAPDARLLAYKVLAAGGWGYDSWIIAGLEAAVDPDGDPLTADHADVINLSLGGPGAPDSALSQAADNAVAAGSIVVAAAGNSGGYWTIGAPGNARDVITVAASDNADAMASFSSRGPVDGATYPKPDLTAPGVAILSTTPGGQHGSFSGTSMAAPHVAGGAALLKQLEPGLTPQRIRSRMAAGAVTLGADLFTQGAGRLDLEAAATDALTALPAMVSFGSVDVTQPAWQQQATVVVRNGGSTSQAVSLALSEPLPAGAQVAFEPATFELAPGAEREVTITLDIDNALLPYPATGAFHYESAIAAGALRIPLAFHKAAELVVAVDTPWDHNLLVYSDDGADLRYVTVAAGQAGRFKVRPGVYHVLTTIWTDGTWAWVGREGIEVVDLSEVELGPALATHRVHVGAIVDAAGGPVGLDVIPGGDLEIRLRDRHAGIEFSLWGIQASSAALFRLPELSDRFELATSAQLRDTRFPADAAVRYRPVAFLPAGVGDDIVLTLDAGAAGRIRLGFSDPVQLGRSPVRIVLVSWEYRVFGDYLVGIGSHRFEPLAFAHPLSSTVYSSLRPEHDTAWSFLQPVVAEMIDADLQWERFIGSPGLLLFPRAGTHAVVEQFDTGSGTLVTSEPSADGNNEIVDGGFHFRSATAQLFGSIVTWSRATMPFFENAAVMRDLNGNLLRVATPYRLTCAGETDAGVHEDGPIPVPPRCDAEPIDLRFGFSVDVLGEATPSELAQHFPAERQPFSMTPWLSQLDLLDGGVPSRALIGDHPQVRLKWEGWDFLQHGLSLRLDRAAWRDLPTRREGEFLVAELPVLPRLHVASLRAFAEYDSGRSEHTLNRLFLLGQGDSLPVFVDGFED